MKDKKPVILFIQVPCHNEEETLPVTLKNFPSKIEGVDDIKVMVIDDGSTDSTCKVAEEQGTDYIVRLDKNLGLSNAFMTGIEHCLEKGADIIVNTDGDNQYCGKDIPRLIAPILDDEADIVIGRRPIQAVEHFSWLKKKIQTFGSLFVKKLTDADISDATSGFRAYSKKAALQLNLVSEFSHTIETIVQAANKGLRIIEVPINVNEKLRESRLYTHPLTLILNQGLTLISSYIMYRGHKIFSSIGICSILLGVALYMLASWKYFFTPYGFLWPLVFIGTLFGILGIFLTLLGLLSSQICSNRKLIENYLLRERIHRFKLSSEKKIIKAKEETLHESTD